MLQSDKLKNLLAASSIKWEVECIDCTDSTNDELARRYSCSEIAPSMILWSEEQACGRGRLKRNWYSIPGKDITASVVFPSPVERSCVHKLVLPAGLALAKVLRDEFGLDAMVRWPNDVLVGGRKVAGILCSYLTTPNAVVCGIGINVNSTPDDLEIETYTPATSIFIESGMEVSREHLLGSWLLEFEKMWHLAQDENIETLREMFDEVSFYRGMRVRILHDAASERDRIRDDEARGITGMAAGLSLDGSLVIEVDDGTGYPVKIDDVIIPL